MQTFQQGFTAIGEYIINYLIGQAIAPQKLVFRSTVCITWTSTGHAISVTVQ